MTNQDTLALLAHAERMRTREIDRLARALSENFAILSERWCVRLWRHLLSVSDALRLHLSWNPRHR